MHRIYTKAEYFEKVAMLQEIVPDASLGTDIIVGFPTETEEDFQETLAVFDQIPYSVAFIFAFSARQGTPAMRWKDDVPEEVKEDRLHRLMAVHAKQAAAERTRMLGSTVEVLFEKQTETGMLKGRTRCWKKVLTEGPSSLVGQLGHVKVHSFHHQTLLGNLEPPTT